MLYLLLLVVPGDPSSWATNPSCLFSIWYQLPAAGHCPRMSWKVLLRAWHVLGRQQTFRELKQTDFFSCLLPAIFRVLPFLEISYKYTPTVGSIFCVKLLSKFFLPIFCYPFCVSTCPIIFTSRKWEQGHRKDQEMLEIRVKSPLLTLSKSLFWIYFPSRSMMFIILHPFFLLRVRTHIQKIHPVCECTIS